MTSQLTLIEHPHPALCGSRPKLFDADVVESAVSASLQAFQKYLKEDPSGEEELRDVLRKLLSRHDSDGYVLARRLEREFHFMESRELVELCDGLVEKWYRARDVFVSRWISTFKIQPQHKIGDAVTVTYEYGSRAGTHLGEITEIRSEQGLYVVFIAAHGHVRVGMGTHGWVIPWEEIDGAWI